VPFGRAYPAQEEKSSRIILFKPAERSEAMDMDSSFSQIPVGKSLSACYGLNLANIALTGDTDLLAENGIPSDTFLLSSMPGATMADKADMSNDEMSLEGFMAPRGRDKRAETDHGEAARENASEPPCEPTIPDKVITITVLHTNDIHGIADRLPALSATLSVLKKENPDAVMVDAGDIGYSAKPVDEPFRNIVSYLNENGYLCVVPGNHDFQFSKERAVNDLFKKLDAEVLAANVLDRKTGKPLERTKPFIIKEINGVKVGFMGIATTKMFSGDYPEAGKDLIVFDEIETLQRDVALAREQGAEVLVAIAHKGLSDVKEIKGLARQVPELDLIIAAHDHKVERTSIRTGAFPHRTYIAEAGSYGNFVGSVSLMVDPETRSVVMAAMRSWPTEEFVSVRPPSGKTSEAPGT
jgi:hypothetical protein